MSVVGALTARIVVPPSAHRGIETASKLIPLREVVLGMVRLLEAGGDRADPVKSPSEVARLVLLRCCVRSLSFGHAPYSHAG